MSWKTIARGPVGALGRLTDPARPGGPRAGVNAVATAAGYLIA